MVKLILVRHGATAWSERGRLTGWRDIPLNRRGRDQAKALQTRLCERFASVWSSDLRRASETAGIAVGAARIDPRLRELDFGSIEGATWASLPEALRAEALAFDGFRAPGGESVADLRARVLSLVGELGPGIHLLFTHGGVIRTLLRPFDRDVTVRPGELVELVVDGGDATERPWRARPEEDVPTPDPLRAGRRLSGRLPGS